MTVTPIESAKEQSLFERLSAIDCSNHIEKKGKFSYLSWAWAWDTLKRNCPEARFQKHTFTHVTKADTPSEVFVQRELPYMKDAQGFAYVKVTVFTNNDTQTEVFPVLNHSNKPVQNPNAFDVNTALQRCLVKAIAMLGLGLYIYAGEDLPEGAESLAGAEVKASVADTKPPVKESDSLGDIF
jgi:hypothetical protein